MGNKVVNGQPGSKDRQVYSAKERFENVCDEVNLATRQIIIHDHQDCHDEVHNVEQYDPDRLVMAVNDSYDNEKQECNNDDEIKYCEHPKLEGGVQEVEASILLLLIIIYGIFKDGVLNHAL